MRKFRFRRLGLADDPGHYKPSLTGCIEAVLEQSDVLMDEVLQGLHMGLVPIPGRGKSALDGDDVREAVEALQPTALKATFAEQLRLAVFGGQTQRDARELLVRFEDFQFLDSRQIDANIEIALTQQEVVRAVEDVLPTLNAMVSNLLGWASVQAHLNPLKPESFVHALRDTFRLHIPDDAVRSPVMTLAAGRLGDGLRLLYRETSDWLRSQGVEPVLVPQVHTGGLGATPKPPQGTVARTMLTLDKLRRLLSGELDTGPVSPNATDFTHTVPASFEALEDLQLVEPMMKRLALRASQSESSAYAQAQVSDLLADEMTQAQTKRLGRQLGEEVVRLMLDSLMQDQRLLAPVRDGLKSMEPVLIRLANIDARFFTERQHAARLFLERMTHRSLAFSSAQEPGFARFFKTFENALGVLAGGAGDATSFARVLRKLEEGWSREERELRDRAEEAARGLLHAEQRNLLAHRLAAQYTERLIKKEVPDMVLAFLRGPWAQVVAEAQLKFADGSVDPFGFQSLVDDLIWSVQLKLARRNRARLVQMVPGMLVKMRQGLQLIAYPEERMGVFFDQLIDFHEKAFEGARMASLDIAPPVASEPSVSAVDVWIVGEEAADSDYLEVAQSEPLAADSVPTEAGVAAAQQAAWSIDRLNTGSWVDLALSTGWVRAQLTWASPHRTLFMFISGAGMAHSMSRRTMERLKEKDLIRLFSDGHVMDNALDAVAQAALQNDLDREPRSR
jgi:hypothetical protein